MPGFSVNGNPAVCQFFEYGIGPTTGDAGYAGPSNIIETARKNRYRLAGIMNGGTDSQSSTSGTSSTGYGSPLSTFMGAAQFLLYAYKCSRPSIDYQVIEIHNGAEQITRPGKIIYNNVEFTFYEIMETSITDAQTGSGNSAPPVTKSVSNFLYKWHSEIMYDRIGAMLRRPDQFLATVDLDMLDGVGKSVYKYRMYDCWPSKVSPSDLSYVDSEICDITVTLQLNRYIESSVGDFA